MDDDDLSELIDAALAAGDYDMFSMAMDVLFARVGEEWVRERLKAWQACGSPVDEDGEPFGF